MLSGKLRAFTLIELLIVVAIIAILAAIAVPNFLEAQVRSKVSRCRTDMRSIATALESYRTDSNMYPPDTYGLMNLPGWDAARLNYPGWSELNVLTTPVAYITTMPYNIFVNKKVAGANYQRYRYMAEATLALYSSSTDPLFERTGKMWAVWTAGPDMVDNQGQNLLFGLAWLLTRPPFGATIFHGGLYDPTNGTISGGDIVRVGP